MENVQYSSVAYGSIFGRPPRKSGFREEALKPVSPGALGSVETESSSSSRSERTVAQPASFRYLLPVFLAQLVPFLAIARYRLIDGDEGFYLMASKLVFQHKVPYRDFFFTQTPLLPYVYGLWMHFAGHSWIAARMFSGGLAALVGTVLFGFVLKETGKPAFGVAAILLSVSSTMVFAWFTIVKTYALSELFLVLAFVCWHYSPRVTWRRAAISGCLLGLASDTRLFAGAILPLFVWWIFSSPSRSGRRTNTTGILAGFALAVFPNLYFLLLDPQAYVFNNLGFHAMRSGQGLIGGYLQKLGTILKTCFLLDAGNGLQIILLLAFLFLVSVRLQAATLVSRRAAQSAGALAVISLLPTPSYTQYFCLCVPFLIVSCLCASGAWLKRAGASDRRQPAAATFALVALFAAASAWDYQRFCETGISVGGIHTADKAINWKIDTVLSVSRAIDAMIRPGERVLSLWPGYIFESRATPFPGLENNTGREIADSFSPAQLAHYHVVSREGVERALSRHDPRLVVVGNQESMMWVSAEPYLVMLSAYGYTKVHQIGDTTIWSAPL